MKYIAVSFMVISVISHCLMNYQYAVGMLK